MPHYSSSLLRFCLILFVAALVFRMGIVLATRDWHDLRRTELERVALSLAEHGTFGNPYAVPTGPSAHVTPGYVLILAALFKLLGTGAGAEFVKELLTCAVSSLRCALIPLAGVQFGLSERTSRLAGVFSVFWIAALGTEIKGDWDTPYTALLLLCLTVLYYRYPLRESGFRWAVVLGIAWGVAFLFSSSLIPVLAGFLLTDAYIARGTGRTLMVMRRGLLTGCCCLLVLLPWGIRNRIELGKYIFTRSNFGLELSLSYHDGASWSNIPNVKEDPDSLHPLFGVAEARRVAQLGEVAYNREKQRKATLWIASHPKKAAWLTFLHFFHFWFPPGRNTIHSVVLWCFTAIALVGLFLLTQTNSLLTLYLVSIMITYPLVYYLIQWSSRYRYPIDWVFVILACVFLERSLGFFRQRWAGAA